MNAAPPAPPAATVVPSRPAPPRGYCVPVVRELPAGPVEPAWCSPLW